ncbi:MAG: ArnT family glycosyltransferase [Acidobacteriaceae bacterium]
MTLSTIVRPAGPALRQALRLAAIFAAIKLLFQFALTLYTQHLGYGYFRDEFYYIACGRHLAWGFVDHGPIVALQARLGELLFGDSLFAIRILSALAGAFAVFLTGVLAWSLGGRRPAQALAMFALILAPEYIGVDGYLSMNSWEPVFWMTCVLALILLQQGRSPVRWWIIFGAAAGVGLLNKPSMAFFLIAICLGLLCTSQRRLLFTRWAALGVALLLAIALPNVLWQIHNHWPTLEFLRNGQTHHKNVVLNPLQFFLAQFAAMQPVASLLWIVGIVSLLRARSIQSTRWLGLAALFFYAIMYALHAKDYYLAGIYPALFAAGAIAWEHRFAASPAVQRNRLIAFPVFESILLITGLIILPLSSPVLRPEAWVRYTTALHLHSSKTETASTGPLPQFYADRFGWQQQVDIVAATFHALAPEEQKRVCIFADNYGEAGAIDFLGRREHAHLPPALSGQNSYWSWGTHGCDPNLVIAVIGDTPQEVATKYESVTIVGVRNNPFAMPFERGNIYLLRNRRPSAPFHWADERFYF